MTSFGSIERILQTYTLEEIFELNDLTDEEVLFFLVQHGFVELPNPQPVDCLYDED